MLFDRYKILVRRDTMPRRARLDAPGTLHHVMVRGIERRRIVNDVADRINFFERLGELAAGTKKFNSIRPLSMVWSWRIVG
jgi:hypothetical protein